MSQEPVTDAPKPLNEPEEQTVTPKAPKASQGIRKGVAFAGVGLVIFLMLRSCQTPQMPTVVASYPQAAEGQQKDAEGEPEVDPKQATRLLTDQAAIARNANAAEAIKAYQAAEAKLVCTRASQLLNDAEYDEATSGMPVERSLFNKLRATQQELAKAKYQKGAFSGKAEDIGIARSLLQDGLALSMALQAEQTGQQLEQCAIDPTQAILWGEKYLQSTDLVLSAGSVTRIADRKPEEGK